MWVLTPFSPQDCAYLGKGGGRVSTLSCQPLVYPMYGVIFSPTRIIACRVLGRLGVPLRDLQGWSCGLSPCRVERGPGSTCSQVLGVGLLRLSVCRSLSHR